MCTITIDRERRLVTIIMLLQSDVCCDLWLDRVLITEQNKKITVGRNACMTTSHMCRDPAKHWKKNITETKTLKTNRIETIESHVAFNGGYWIWMGFEMDRFEQRTYFEVESSITISRLCWKWVKVHRGIGNNQQPIHVQLPNNAFLPNRLVHIPFVQQY